MGPRRRLNGSRVRSLFDVLLCRRQTRETQPETMPQLQAQPQETQQQQVEPAPLVQAHQQRHEPHDHDPETHPRPGSPTTEFHEVTDIEAQQQYDAHQDAMETALQTIYLDTPSTSGQQGGEPSGKSGHNGDVLYRITAAKGSDDVTVTRRAHGKPEETVLKGSHVQDRNVFSWTKSILSTKTRSSTRNS